MVRESNLRGPKISKTPKIKNPKIKMPKIKESKPDFIGVRISNPAAIAKALEKAERRGLGSRIGEGLMIAIVAGLVVGFLLWFFHFI